MITNNCHSLVCIKFDNDQNPKYYFLVAINLFIQRIKSITSNKSSKLLYSSILVFFCV